jgi:hypothetical protein
LVSRLPDGPVDLLFVGSASHQYGTLGAGDFEPELGMSRHRSVVRVPNCAHHAPNEHCIHSHGRILRGREIIPTDEARRACLSHVELDKLLRKTSLRAIALSRVRIEKSAKLAQGVYVLDLANYRLTRDGRRRGTEGRSGRAGVA